MSDDTTPASRPFDHQPWTAKAACRGLTVLFFPRSHESGKQRDQREARAMAICATCAVRSQCQVAGEDEAQHGGVWGGVSPSSALPSSSVRSIPHGTYAGYRLHYRRHDAACDPCRLAYNAYQLTARARRAAA